MMDASLAVSPGPPRPPRMSGRFRLEAGDHRGAAEVLDHVISGWNGWARDWSWPLTLAQTAEIVAGLEATEHADVLAAELAPYAGELAVVGAGILCLGAFDRYRGMVLGLLGRRDEAVAALVAALALEESVESPPFTARTRYWLARALLQRDGRGDRDARRRRARPLHRDRRAARHVRPRPGQPRVLVEPAG